MPKPMPVMMVLTLFSTLAACASLKEIISEAMRYRVTAVSTIARTVPDAIGSLVMSWKASFHLYFWSSGTSFGSLPIISLVTFFARLT